jgi:phosphatidylserine/phosphatidylglycerophosphate/cardiolipin synthase-like enzyme
VGEAIDRAVASHHKRRLRKHGHLQSLDPPGGDLWAAGDPPPREGNELDVLIDGSEALPQISAAVAGARSHVHIAGWHVTPGFELTRGVGARRIRDLLGELAERVDVRVLLWAGAPLPLFRPSRAEVRQVRADLVRGTSIRCALDSNERPMHCHHEKLVIVDDRIAFVGGIDLTSLAGDRYDTSEHPALGRLGWHDAATRIRGPAVADVAQHFNDRWREVAGGQLQPPAPPEPAGPHELQIVRTVPEKVYSFLPDGQFRILEAYIRALRSARRLIYLENQFLWSPEIVFILEDKLRNPPTDEFRLVVLLPANPNNGADDTRGKLALLQHADGGAGRFLATTVFSRSGASSGPLYVHAKIGIVDDRWLTVGSANLNEHSLFNDSEMNVVCCDPDLARRTRERLWAEHLELPLDAIDDDPTSVVDNIWRPTARGQLERRHRDLSPTHRLVELEPSSRRVKAAWGPFQSLLVDG